MGRLNSIAEQESTLAWAESYGYPVHEIPQPTSVRGIELAFRSDLKRYFALAALSRSTTAPLDLVSRAAEHVFRSRVRLERAIMVAILRHVREWREPADWLFEGAFYGSSKKQGVSLRVALVSCQPTRLCASACYAHDVLDAAPAAIVRGAINAVVAECYEMQPPAREGILARLLPHTVRAIRAAEREVERLPSSWRRLPRIRFSHVGEIVAFPNFANDLARQIRDASNGRVRCVVYTRHRRAAELQPDLFVVNFTIDQSSEGRRRWAPPGARIVYSAFDGRVSPRAEVNFLEHHRWRHATPVGLGNVCPATLPEATERTCDGARCQRCFVDTGRWGSANGAGGTG